MTETGKYVVRVVGFTKSAYANMNAMDMMTDLVQQQSAQGDFFEYVIEVTDRSSGDKRMVRRRYREFRDLHEHLKLRFGDSLAEFPPKKLWGNSDPSVLASRQHALDKYMVKLTELDPECSSTWLLKSFLGLDREPSSGSRGSSQTQSPSGKKDPSTERKQSSSEGKSAGAGTAGSVGSAPSVKQTGGSESSMPGDTSPAERQASALGKAKPHRPDRGTIEAIKKLLPENFPASVSASMFDLSLEPSLLPADQVEKRAKAYSAVLQKVNSKGNAFQIERVNQLVASIEKIRSSQADDVKTVTGIFGRAPIITNSDAIVPFPK